MLVRLQSLHSKPDDKKFVIFQHNTTISNLFKSIFHFKLSEGFGSIDFIMLIN